MANIKAASGIVQMIDRATKPLRTIAKSFQNLGKSSDQANTILSKSQKAINDLSKAQNRLNRVQANMNRRTKDIGSQAVGIAATGLAFKQALQPAINFEQAMKDLESVAFGSADATVDVVGSMKTLSQQAKNLGATTAFSATQAAEGQIFLAKAGFKTNEIIASMPGLLNLAASSGTELGRSSDILSDLLGAFGSTAKDSGKLVDILAAATSSANVDMETLFETLKVAAPIGIAAGQSIEGITTATALLGNVGIKGSMAGTALKNAFVNLAAPAASGSKALKELGINVSDSNGNMLPLEQIMVKLGKSAKNLSQVKRIEVFDAIFGKIAMAGAINLEKAVNSGDFAKMLKNLQNSAGVAEKMAKIKLDSTQGSLTILMSSLEGVAITFGTILTPAIKGAAEVLASLGEPLQNIIENNKGLIAAVGGVAGALLALKVGMLAYTAAIWLVTPAITALKVVLGTLKIAMIAFNAVASLNPLGAIVISIGLLIAGAVALVTHWDKVTETFRSLGDIIRNISFGNITSSFSKIKSLFGFGSSTPEVKNNQQQLTNAQNNTKVLQGNSTNNNNAIINVNIENDKVKSVKSEGAFETKAFINPGIQQ